MRHTTTAALAAVLLLGLTGCSSSSGDDREPAMATPPAEAETPPPANAEDDLEQAVRAYSAAYFTPDPPAAYGMLSARCKTEIDANMYKAQLQATAKDYGQQAIRTFKVDQASGDLARVTYTYAVPKLNQKGQPWTREGETWKYDAC